MSIKKENFIHILSSLNQEELNDIIKNKGKDPKIIPGLIYSGNKKLQIQQLSN